MQETTFWAMLGVTSLWTSVAIAIWRWGPSRTRRSVYCPQKNLRSQIIVERCEGDFGCLRKPDVVACSLMPDGQFVCDKRCVIEL